MKNKFLTKLAPLAMTLGLGASLALPMVAAAQTDYGLNSNFNNVDIGKDTDLKGTIAQIINVILGFLGIIAVIIILAGGFKWMTASGNEDKVGEARKMIVQGVIGLVIVFAAWGIASFAISSLVTATT